MSTIIIFTIKFFLKLFQPKSSVSRSEVVTFFTNSTKSDDEQIVAHRGAALDAPENTLEAVKLAKFNEAQAIEFDLEFSSDGIPVIFHDDTLERTTNGTGNIREKTYLELQALNASYGPFKERFNYAKIPTLNEMVDLCLELNLKMYIDVKGIPSKSVPALIKLYKERPSLYKMAIVCGFNPLVAYKLRRQDANIIIGLTHRKNFLYRRLDDKCNWFTKKFYAFSDLILEWSIKNILLEFIGASVLLLHLDDVNQNVVDRYCNENVKLVVWTVNEPDQKVLFHRKYSCPIITDTLLNYKNSLL